MARHDIIQWPYPSSHGADMLDVACGGGDDGGCGGGGRGG